MRPPGDRRITDDRPRSPGAAFRPGRYGTIPWKSFGGGVRETSGGHAAAVFGDFRAGTLQRWHREISGRARFSGGHRGSAGGEIFWEGSPQGERHSRQSIHRRQLGPDKPDAEAAAMSEPFAARDQHLLRRVREPVGDPDQE